MTVAWVALVGDVNVLTVGGGALLASGVTVAFPLLPVRHRGRLRPWGVVVLVAALLRDLAVASVRLAVFALTTREPRSGVLRVDLRSDSDLYEVNTAELASVVPGSIVIDARRRTRRLYLHVFDLPDPAARDAVVADTLALERRVLGALASDAERAAAAAGKEGR